MKYEVKMHTDEELGGGGNVTYTEWLDDQGRRHRERGPAMVSSQGDKEWYKHGLLHRNWGPAVIWPDGAKDWYKNGVFIKEKRAKKRK